jgi:uncharacterized protein (DUF1778 family)
MKKKRIIAAYKGGRNEQFTFRLTKEEKEFINKARGEKSLVDFILELMKKTNH